MSDPFASTLNGIELIDLTTPQIIPASTSLHFEDEHCTHVTNYLDNSDSDDEWMIDDEKLDEKVDAEYDETQHQSKLNIRQELVINNDDDSESNTSSVQIIDPLELTSYNEEEEETDDDENIIEQSIPLSLLPQPSMKIKSRKRSSQRVIRSTRAITRKRAAEEKRLGKLIRENEMKQWLHEMKIELKHREPIKQILAAKYAALISYRKEQRESFDTDVLFS